MSWLHRLISWMDQRFARENIFRAAALIIFCTGQAIFADITYPAELAMDMGPPPAIVTVPANSPAPLSATTNPVFIPVPAAEETNGNFLLQTNLMTPVDPNTQKLETASYLIKTRQTQNVEPMLVSLLDKNVPEPIQSSALLELARLAQLEDDLPRAQQILAQFVDRWPDDNRVLEALLLQGRIFREMGLHDLALTKFYAVMTAALTLKNDRLDDYEHVVLEAQIEIAETHFELGEYDDAADYFSRLFNQENPEINKPEILYKLICCYSYTTNYDEVVGNAQEFLAHYPNQPEEPEVRFDLAIALQQLGRNDESLQQVLTLLQEQSTRATENPENWEYWQQRVGNLIANQFYREGDYVRALDIYDNLAQLDHSPQWQLPVWYQIGTTYEHLMQPQKAMDIYNRIVSRETDLGTNATPDLVSIADMARWRVGFIQWQGNAISANRELAETNATFTTTTMIPANLHE